MEKKIPTLMIGLGGTGAKAADIIAAAVKKRLESDQRPLICVDTDAVESDEMPAASAASEYKSE
ncbi:MAG: hypothetical protein IJD13_01065 [Oscillospiraceae bacterium]|nr:hypothetical protein [Oscillospiraceae bacterium]